MASAAPAEMMRTIWGVLAGVPDPEIPVISIVDLGIVRTVTAEPPRVTITPTYTGCPATQAIERAIRNALDEAGFPEVTVATMISPPWSTDWISNEGREKLRAFGIAPPTRGAPACPADPVGSPEFRRLYDRAAAPGAGAAPAASARPGTG